jgi:outer membrane protein TolC
MADLLKKIFVTAVIGILTLSESYIFAQLPPVINLRDVFSSVAAYHPQSRQAGLRSLFANEYVRKASGSFDPTLGASIHQKYYEEKTYFSVANSELKIPTWIGADIKAGFETNRGLFLNPELTTPTEGLFYAGISLPLGQGLLIDERRARVQEARIGKEIALAETADMLNSLLLSTSNAYLDWLRAYQIREVYRQSLNNANQRFNASKLFAASGDRPAIDTVEAKAQASIIAIDFAQASVSFDNAGIILSSFIWDGNGNNRGLPKLSIPDVSDFSNTSSLQSTTFLDSIEFMKAHPYLQQISLKNNQLQIEQKFRKDRLKPQLLLEYNPIAAASENRILPEFNTQNFKWALSFYMPLLLRKERADVKLTQLKILENNWVLQDKSRELYNKYNAYYNLYQNLIQQEKIQADNVNLLQTMLSAEQRLFDIGESSVFLVNAREMSALNARIKRIDLQYKIQLAYATMQYLAGKLPESAGASIN